MKPHLLHINIALFMLAGGLGAYLHFREPSGAGNQGAQVSGTPVLKKRVDPLPQPRNYRVVHVFVALCDNKHQGIVKVPKALGNGQDPRNNLYWGALYGVKTFFGKSHEWKRVPAPGGALPSGILERVVFKRRSETLYVIADAYDGSKMRLALQDFFGACSGSLKVRVPEQEHQVSPDLVCFAGHNGLMDIRNLKMPPVGQGKRGAMVFACKSKAYFASSLKQLGCQPIVTTTGFMAPEAYVLDAAIRAWADGEPIRDAAGKAYAKYQKISERAGVRLFSVFPIGVENVLAEASESEFGSGGYLCEDTVVIAKKAGIDYEKVVNGCLKKETKFMHTLFWLSKHGGFDAASSQGHSAVLEIMIKRQGDEFFGACLSKESSGIREAVHQDLVYGLGVGAVITFEQLEKRYPRTFGAP